MLFINQTSWPQPVQRLLRLLGMFTFLSLALSVSHASPRVFTLVCDGERAWPSGVPATLTSYENLQVFQRWCDESGMPELDVEMMHTPDLRLGENRAKSYTIEGSATFNGDDYSTLEEAQAAAPSVNPQSKYQTFSFNDDTGFSSKTKFVYDYNSGFVWNSFIESVLRNDGSVTVIRIMGSVEDRNFKDACHYGSFFSSENSKTHISCSYRTSQKALPKKTCTPHHHYIFKNTVSEETTSFSRDGGSCYTLKEARLAKPKGAPLEEPYVTVVYK